MKKNYNVLSKEDYSTIRATFLSEDFIWNYYRYISDDKDKYYIFKHTYVKDSNFFGTVNHFNDFLKPLFEFLKIKTVINVTAYLMTKSLNAKKGFDLTSVNKKTKTAIFYIEHNNGYTKFKKENIENEGNMFVSFSSKENRIEYPTTNKERRIFLNIEYE